MPAHRHFAKHSVPRHKGYADVYGIKMGGFVDFG